MLRKLLAVTLLAAALVPLAAPAAGTGAGTVFAMTNALEGNGIVVYDRSPEGILTLRETVPTGGLGVGATTEPVDALGSQNPLVLSRDGRWLFAVK